MSQSITHYVQVSVSLAGTGVQPAGFGPIMFQHEHALESARLAGPFTSAQGVLDAGHASGSAPHVAAQAVFAQQPRVTQLYIGRQDSGDVDAGVAFDAILAANPGAWYGALLDSRDEAEQLAWAAALNAASFPKIGLLQSNAASLLLGEGPAYTNTIGGTEDDGDYDLIFTGFGLVSPVTVTIARTAGSPADNEALAEAQALELATQADTGGDLEDILDLDSIDDSVAESVSFKILDGLASGTITTSQPSGATQTVVLDDADLGSRMFDLGYLRTALLYHPTDTDRVDAAWMSRCLAFNLDQRKGVWSYKRLNGVEATNLTDAQVTQLRDVNANYFSPAVMSAGNTVQAFTAQGWVSGGSAGAGRRIDVTTSLDWAKARIEEAFANVLLRETHGVPYTDAGINRFAAALRGVFTTGLSASHFVAFQVPEGESDEGLNTPAIIVPRLSETTTTERETRTLTFRAIAYLGSFIEKVVFDVEIRQ